MITRKLFTVDLYGYLKEEKAKVCNDYQVRNKRIVVETIQYFEELGKKWEYVQIDSNDEVDAYVKDKSICMIESLPLKYKYQLISDLVRYKYMTEHPDSIYIDTDFCLFGQLGMAVLDRMADQAQESNTDLLAGEMNKNRLFPCNWLMIGGGNKEDNIFKDMYNDLKTKLSVEFYESYIPSPEASAKWPDKLEAYIWEVLWGYAIPRNLSTKKYSMIPYEYFQGCEWNKDWHDDSIMKKRQLVGCHFFGFGEGGRPSCDEFIKYHHLERNI